jgi:glucosamine--fructose-6-phosphate aminotransferase (isomerizing)
MKEMSLSTSEAFHFLEFRHGPKSVITSKTLIAALLSDPARQEELKVLSEMRALGATVMALTESDTGLEMDYTVELNSGLGYLWRGALFLPVLQLLAYYRSINKELDPDRPHNLDAVVKF